MSPPAPAPVERVFVSVILMACWAISPAVVSAGKRPVYVTASLTDRNHLFIQDLSREEAQILEDGQPRTLEFMAEEELPTAYGILFERNLLPESLDIERTRMGRPIGKVSAQEIAYELIDRHLGRQVVWIGVYDRELEVVLDFSADGFRAKKAIQQIRGVPRFQESFLYGALLSAARQMNERAEKRRVLILFLVSADSETNEKSKPLKNLFSASNIEIFIISFASRRGGSRESLHPQMSQFVLKELAQTTAGEAFFSTDYGEHLEDLSRRVYNQIRTLYTFGFQSDSTAERPGRLDIRCRRPGSKVKHHPAVPYPP